jgi:methionine synthase II (cobalamin-independent)
MDHKNEEWNIIGDSQPLWKAIKDNSIVLNNLYNLIQKIEKQQEIQAERLESLQKTTTEIQDKMYQNLKNIDDNIKEIDIDIEDFEKEIDNMKVEMKETKITLMENREIFTGVMDKFMKLEIEEIKPILNQINNAQKIKANSIILPSFEKTIEQNRLWRLYSNNFRQNTSLNTSNILTQLALSKQ